MWDFHVWAALEHWQQRYGVQVRGWLHAIGEIEAIAALAGLAHDHPDWAFPTVNSRFVAFEARALGHPLLSDGARVPNDVRVGPRGRVLCVTGSNMSGKSTLLRAIGTNAVLAQAGAPVCAASLEMPPLSAHTSLRVNDSLQEGVSYFMASLQRLRIILDVARQQHGAGEGNCEQTGTTTRGSDDRPMLLYLLDEILQGTNSAEREVAVRLVLRRLLQARAVGAITTHDLTLTATPELQAAGDHVHFAEAIDGSGAQGMLTFDYRLRPGVATSRNALRLMELVGLVGHAEVEAIDTGRRLDSSPSDPDS
jgi:DNA mismatch repair ATPase MutS